MPRNHGLEPKPNTPKLASYSSVVVTGGLDFVGGHLLRALTRLGKHVVVVDSAVPESDASGLPDVEFRRADPRDHEQAAEAVNGADLVFHLAGNSSGTLSVSGRGRASGRPPRRCDRPG